MPKLKRLQIEICESKTPYITKDEAKRAKHILNKAKGQKASVYQCPNCRCFHLTKQIEQD